MSRPEMITTVYDYLDPDGDMLAVDCSTNNDRWLSLTVVKHGKTAALAVMLDEADDARRLAEVLTAWADKRDKA